MTNPGTVSVSKIPNLHLEGSPVLITILTMKFKPLCPSHFNIYSDKMDSTFLIIDFIPTLGGRPFCPAMSKPDNWGVTAGDKMLEQKI